LPVTYVTIMRRKLTNIAGALLLTGLGATADHLWGRFIDVPFDKLVGWWTPAQEPNLGKEVTIQTPNFTLHLARPLTGTAVEVWPR
jgi:hypothetical protein